MGNGELVVRESDVPAIADDFLIQVADQAERRVDAVMKIKRVALKVTNARDWTDQNGNPYLQVSGSEKIANLFNISWRIEEPRCEEEPDGHFTYSIKGEFSLGGRTIEVEGTRSSKDTFFNKYKWEGDEGKKTKTLLPPSAIDKGDVKKAALTNLFGNGITRILGIRNLTWDDLKQFAGITQEQVATVSYKKEGKSQSHHAQPPIKDPTAPSTEAQQKAIHALARKSGIEDADIYPAINQMLGEKMTDAEKEAFVLIGSTKELTRQQASNVIESLNAKIAEVAKSA